MIRTALTILALAATAAAATASAEPQGKTFRDSMGREVGRSERHGDTTIFYDASGRQTGRSERRNGETIFFNERGERVGTERGAALGGPLGATPPISVGDGAPPTPETPIPGLRRAKAGLS